MVAKPLMSAYEGPFVAFIQEGVIMDVVQPGAVPLPPIDTVIQQPATYQLRQGCFDRTKEGIIHRGGLKVPPKVW